MRESLPHLVGFLLRKQRAWMELVSGLFHVAKASIVIENVGVPAGAVDAVVHASVRPLVQSEAISLGHVLQELGR